MRGMATYWKHETPPLPLLIHPPDDDSLGHHKRLVRLPLPQEPRRLTQLVVRHGQALEGFVALIPEAVYVQHAVTVEQVEDRRH